MKKIRFFTVILAFFGIAFIGCSQGIGADISDTAQGRAVGNNGNGNGNSRNRRSTLALLKSQGNHKVTADELEQIVLNTFNQSTSSNGKKTKIEKVKNVPANNKNKFKNNGNNGNGNGNNGNSGNNGNGNNGKNGRSVTDEYETEPIELFEFTVNDGENEKYVFASNDVRVGHILAITDASLEDVDNDFTRFFDASVQDYINSTVLVYNDITDDEVETARAELDAEQLRTGRAVIVGNNTDTETDGWEHYATYTDMTVYMSPLLTTNWGQGTQWAYSSSGYAYNNYIKYRKSSRWLTGCLPLAVAQIVTYHQYMNTSSYDVWNKMAPSFNTNGGTYIPSIGTWNKDAGYDFGLLRSYPVIKNTAPASVKGQVAALLYHIQEETDGFLAHPYDPNSGEVAAYLASARDALIRFGYNISYITPTYDTETTLTGSNNGDFYVLYEEPLIRIQTSLNERNPFIMTGALSDYSAAHAWVVDGYGYAGTIVEYHYKPGTSETAQRIIYLNTNRLMVHCNLGWDGINRGYAYGGENVPAYQTEISKGGWFVYGIFNTAENLPLSTQDTDAGDRNYSTLTQILLPTR